jgi:hypothetical protein
MVCILEVVHSNILSCKVKVPRYQPIFHAYNLLQLFRLALSFGELAQFHPSVLATRVFVDKVKVKFTPSSTYFLLQPNQFHFDRIE